MPKTLNPQNTFPTSITNFPISGNNEPIAIEPLENAIQAVLNRSENLHVRLSEAETQGVKRVRTVASLAALSAATGFNNGDVCDVEGYGRYRLYNPSALTADGLWVLTATGGGRWVHTLRDMRGIGNGLATLDSSQRLAQDVRDASILTQHIANQAVTSAKLAPGSVVGHLGYTPLNKAGDIMAGLLNINNERLFNVFVSQSDTTVRYYYLGSINSGSGILKINGILGGHTPGEGRANVDLQFAFRDGFRADGYIMGTVDRADVLVRDGGNGWAYVYLVTKQFALVNLELSASDGAHITYNGTYSTSAPSGTTLYQLSDDFTNNTHPNTLKMNDGVLQARYNHRRRFTVSGCVGGTSSGTLSNGNASLRQLIPVQLNNEVLRLVRVRFWGISPTKLRVSNAFTWASGGTDGEYTPNFALSNPVNGVTAVNVELFNDSGSSQTIFPYMSWWLEFEIV